MEINGDGAARDAASKAKSSQDDMWTPAMAAMALEVVAAGGTPHNAHALLAIRQMLLGGGAEVPSQDAVALQLPRLVQEAGVSEASEAYMDEVRRAQAHVPEQPKPPQAAPTASDREEMERRAKRKAQAQARAPRCEH